jgi:hypothetical protein
MAARFHRLAAREFREARDWYRERSAHAADRFAVALHVALDWAIANYSSLQHTSYGCRWTKLKKFPYLLIVQEESPGELLVVAVAHTSRRPAYWRKRV